MAERIPPDACPDELRLAAYHDGELPPADRADVQRHVLSCPPCVGYLAELGRVSAWLATAGSAVGLTPLAAGPACTGGWTRRSTRGSTRGWSGSAGG